MDRCGASFRRNGISYPLIVYLTSIDRGTTRVYN